MVNANAAEFQQPASDSDGAAEFGKRNGS